MKRLLRDLVAILVLAGLWGLSGYFIGIALETVGIEYPLRIIFASLNLIFGMTLFLNITRDPTADRLFFEGPGKDGQGDPRIGCLWAMPMGLILFGLLMWFWAILIRFLFPQ